MARYSSDNQREESIEGQLRECREYAGQNDMRVLECYMDRALSAKTDDRPQFQRMIRDSSTRKFEAVLVWKLDRFARNRYDSANYKRILKNNGVRLISVKEPISNTPESILLESLLEGMAEYYSVELAEKVNRGHTENALKLKFNGGVVPMGYVIDKERHYQIDPATAQVVREAFERYAGGENIVEIITDFNSRGLRGYKGKPFTVNSFQRILKNRRYIGEYRYRDIVRPGAIPAIVDEETFNAVQRRRELNRMAPAHTKAEVDYILTGKLFCGECGTPMAGESGKNQYGAVYSYYKCSNRKRNGTEACGLRPVPKEPLERYVAKVAAEVILKPEMTDKIIKVLLGYQEQSENTRLPVLEKELAEVKRRIDNLIAAIEQGILTPATKQRMDELEQQRTELEISILKEQIEKPPITEEMLRWYFAQFQGGSIENAAYRKHLIDCFVNSVYIFGDRGVINFNMEENSSTFSLQEAKSSFLQGNGAPFEANSNLILFRDGFGFVFPLSQIFIS